MARSTTAGVWAGLGLAIGAPLLLLVTALHIDDLQLRDHRQQLRETAAETVGRLRARMETEITARIALVDALGSFVVTFPDVDERNFSLFSEDLMRGHKGIRALQLAPRATVRFSQPLAGNEAAIGHDLLADPERAPAVRQAIASLQTVVAGPFPLRQGGLAAVARKPIHRRNAETDTDEFWGLGMVVLDIPPLLEQAGLTAPTVGRLSVAIRGKDGRPDPNSVFFGDPAVFAGDPLIESITFPSGQWQIAAVPLGGWPHEWPGRFPFLFAVGAVAALAIGLGLTLARQTQNLRHAVRDATVSRAKFKTLFDESLQLIGTLTPDGRVTAVNRAAADIIGIQPDDVVGQSFWDTPWWSHDPQLQQRLRDAIAAAGAGDMVRFEADHPRADGAMLRADVSIKPLRDPDGKVTQLLAEGRDITERKAAEQAVRENEALYHEMFLTNTAIKLLIDPDQGVIVDANKAAVDYYGYPRETLIGMPIWTINTASPEEVQQKMEAARQTQRGDFHFRHRLASGVVRDVEVYSGPVTRRGRVLLHSIIHDITERVRLEQELRRSNAELEQFAYAASHDLREPLRMVSSFVGLLSRRYGPQLDDTGRELLAFAEDGAKRMDRMILDLLEYSRVGRFERPMQPWPLGDLIAAALRPLSIAIAEAGAVVTVQPDLPQVKVSHEEMVRALTNLIGNAVKYHRSDVAPDIRVGAEIQGDKVILSVADNGIGIAPEYFERIFQLFQRLHGREQYEGTGIGLALVKKVIERHGGRIWVESAGENQGATFYASLPKVC